MRGEGDAVVEAAQGGRGMVVPLAEFRWEFRKRGWNCEGKPD